MLFQRSHTNTTERSRLLLTLTLGLVLGFSIAQLLQSSDCLLNNAYLDSQPIDLTAEESQSEAEYVAAATPKTPALAAQLTSTMSELAGKLYNETRVLCWVLTSPSNHAKRAVHVKNTWGMRCNKLLFMSSEEDQALGAIKLPVGEGRGNLWQKTREAAKYIYDHHFHEADWFLKADDDTYIIAENLRAFLYQFNPEEPVYFGCKFKPHVRQGYMSGGAGYVLSKEALRRFVIQAYPNSKICRQRSGGSEDKEMGYCLQNVGVVAGDSRDKLKRGRFFPSGPQGHLIPKDKTHWYWRYVFYATKDGPDCCSNTAISFHYIQPNYFYVLDYLIYELHPFGRVYNNDMKLPLKLNTTALMVKWRYEVSDKF